MKKFENISHILFDWGNTLMRDIPGMTGPMADWQEVEAMAGALELLQFLPESITVCLASNAGDSDAKLIREALKRVKMDRYFKHILTSDELGTKKPDTAFFTNALQLMKCAPENVLSVGDNLEKDIIPAKSAGMVTCWITSAEDRPEYADFCLKSLDEMIPLLDVITS